MLADASVFPELGGLYSISSGLVPSFHFLDAEARPLASFPPLGSDELSFYLDDIAERVESLPPLEPRPVPAVEIPRDRAANRIARLFLTRFEQGDESVAPPHADVDFSVPTFLLEYAATRPWRQDVLHVLGDQMRSLLESGLWDGVDGGFHRAAATSDRAVAHREKTLRPNAGAVGLLASWYRMTHDRGYGASALLTIAFLNERLRTRGTTLYAGSLAADVWSGDELVLEGTAWYRLDRKARDLVGAPPASADIPVGANFLLHRSLRECFRVFMDETMQQATWRGGRELLEAGFLPSGVARRTLDDDSIGHLGDQADAGSGLIAYHGLTGEPRALEQAIAVARGLAGEFATGEAGVFASVSDRADLPDLVRATPPSPAWNGRVLVFLAELSAVTRDDDWRETALRGLDRWTRRVPANARGAGELGRAALRLEAPVPVLAVVGEPESPIGEELATLAHRLFDPLVLVRWISPDDRRTTKRFGIDPGAEPAVYLVWDETSPPIRDAVTLRAAFDAGRERVRPE